MPVKEEIFDFNNVVYANPEANAFFVVVVEGFDTVRDEKFEHRWGYQFQ